jgi:hypothetical protein
MATPNLGITYIQAAQNQKEVTANAGFLALDEALFQPTTIALSDADFYAAGGGSPAVTNLAFNFTGTLSDNRTVYLPGGNPKMYLVNNNTAVANQSPVVSGKTLTFKCPDGSPAIFGRTVTVLAGSGYHLLYCDGANVDEIQVSQENSNITLAPGDANYILSAQNALTYLAFTFTGVLSDNRAVMLPSIAKWYLIKNSTTAVNTGSKNLIFEIPSTGSPAVFGRTVTVPPGSVYMMLYTDGVNVDIVASVPVGFGVYAAGAGSNNQILLYLKMDRPTIIPAGAKNSFAVASIAATNSTTYTLKKNGTAFATIVFSSSGTTGVFTQAADAVFVPGDIFEIDGPASADGTLANVGFTIQGFRY